MQWMKLGQAASGRGTVGWMNYCYFCKREHADSQCETCKRYVCHQCADCHNCYPRE